MKTTFLVTAVLSSLVSSRPATQAFCTPPTTPFFLVTTWTPTCVENSTSLPDASAISLYDPNHQTTLVLRTILPGYMSLPNFTLTDGALQTIASGPFGATTQLYNSTTLAAGQALGFAAAANPAAGLSLEAGYLLANGGETEGWTLCTVSGETVVSTHPSSLSGQ